MPLRLAVEPQSAPVTSKASPKVPPQVGNVLDESDDDLSYATPIGPALPRTLPRAPILLLQPSLPPRRSSRNSAPRRAY